MNARMNEAIAPRLDLQQMPVRLLVPPRKILPLGRPDLNRANVVSICPGRPLGRVAEASSGPTFGEAPSPTARTPGALA